MKKDFNLIIATTGFISAIFISSFFKFGFSFFLFLILISIVLCIFQKFASEDAETKKKIILLIVFIFSFSLGVLRYEIKDLNFADINLENKIGDKVIIEAVVSDEPTRKDSQAVLIVDFKNIIEASSSLPVSGKGIISTDLYPEIKYGDLIKINGKLEKPENISDASSSNNPGQIKSQFNGVNFDYVSYLAKNDIFYKIDFAKTLIISENNGNIIKNFLFKIKTSFINKIDKVVKEPESSLLAGILLGSKNSIDEKTAETFRAAGLSHIVALSGYNITIVAETITKSLSFLPRNIAMAGGVIGIILFVLMTGASSTAVRAGIMSLIVVLAASTHRKYKIGRALIFAGLIMIIVNPKILVFDTSFQLSFLATIAIVYVSPILKNKLTFITEKFKLRETVSSTISAQILVLPLILYKMNLLSLVALPANILVLPLIPYTMYFGFFTGIFGFIWYYISVLFGWIVFIPLFLIINVSTFFANFPFSTINTGWFSKTIMILCYIFITIWIRTNIKTVDR